MLEQLKEIICQYVDVDPEAITEDARFVEDLGLNSYVLWTMVGKLREFYVIEVEEREVVGIRTVGEAIEYIEKLQNEE